jgi:hypothetical protein
MRIKISLVVLLAVASLLFMATQRGEQAILTQTVASGGITLVAGGAGAGYVGTTSLSAVTTGSLNTTGATLLTMCSTGFPSNWTTGAWASDSKSNTWQYLTFQKPSFADTQLQIAYVYGPTVGSGHTFTFTGSGALTINVEALAWNNTLTSSSVFDKQNGATNNAATSLSTGNVTPSIANELLLTCWGTGGTGGSNLGLAVNNSFSIIDTQCQSSQCIGIADLIDTGTSAIAATWSQTGSQEVGASIGTFEP